MQRKYTWRRRSPKVSFKNHVYKRSCDCNVKLLSLKPDNINYIFIKHFFAYKNNPIKIYTPPFGNRYDPPNIKCSLYYRISSRSVHIGRFRSHRDDVFHSAKESRVLLPYHVSRNKVILSFHSSLY